MVIDSHAHLNDARLHSNLPHWIEAARAAGLSAIINVGYDLPSSELAVNQAQRFPEIYAAVGVHPHDAATWTDQLATRLEALSYRPRVQAWGEIGLDFHYDNSPRDVQEEVFAIQLELAKRRGLPVIIHNRDAHAAVLRILQQHAPYPAGGVMHCYSSSPEMLPAFLELGFYISLAGPVTFKNSRRLPEVVRRVPLDRLLAETDSPYMAPEPYRGKLNHPALVTEVIRKMAEILEMEYADVAQTTAANGRRLFRLPPASEAGADS